MMLVVLISGIIIETTSKISQILRKNAPFNIDKWFLFWVLIFSIICGLILQIPLVISLQITLLISIIITLIVYGIWKIDFYKKKVWLWIILLAILFAVVTGMPEIKNFISFINN